MNLSDVHDVSSSCHTQHDLTFRSDNVRSKDSKNPYQRGQIYIISNPYNSTAIIDKNSSSKPSQLIQIPSFNPSSSPQNENINSIYKIGFTSDWNHRQRSYRTSIPNFNLEYLSIRSERAYQVEQSILSEYTDCRIINNSTGHMSEWLKCDLLTLVSKIEKGLYSTSYINTYKIYENPQQDKSVIINLLSSIKNLFFGQSTEKNISNESVIDIKKTENCQWILKSGPRKGELCSSVVVHNSTYCTRHAAKILT